MSQPFNIVPLLDNWQNVSGHNWTQVHCFFFYPFSLPLPAQIRRRYLFLSSRMFSQVNEIILHRVQEKLFTSERKKMRQKEHIKQQDPQFSAEKDKNLIIVLNTCLGYVKRHKLVRSHLKSRSIVQPLTKPILTCILTKFLHLPAFCNIFSWIRVLSIVCHQQKTNAYTYTQTILG